MKTLEMMTKEELIQEVVNARESFESALLEIEEIKMDQAGQEEYMSGIEKKIELLESSFVNVMVS